MPDIREVSTEDLIAELTARGFMGEDIQPDVTPRDPRDEDEELRLMDQSSGLGCTFCDSPRCNGSCEDDE